MKHCIACKKALTPATRSAHQPTIRCAECFRKFAEGVEAVLGGFARCASEFAREREAAMAAKETKDA